MNVRPVVGQRGKTMTKLDKDVHDDRDTYQRAADWERERGKAAYQSALGDMKGEKQ